MAYQASQDGHNHASGRLALPHPQDALPSLAKKRANQSFRRSIMGIKYQRARSLPSPCEAIR
jgi:hypothetical protein